MADDNSSDGNGNDIETWTNGQGGTNLGTPGNSPSYDSTGCNGGPGVSFVGASSEYMNGDLGTIAQDYTIIFITYWNTANADFVFDSYGSSNRVYLWQANGSWQTSAAGPALLGGTPAVGLQAKLAYYNSTSGVI